MTDSLEIAILAPAEGVQGVKTENLPNGVYRKKTVSGRVLTDNELIARKRSFTLMQERKSRKHKK